MKKFFTSESVTEGHPDKICDRISDSILDEILKINPYARVACETLVTTGMVMIVGEITLPDGYIDIPKLVRSVIKEIGYDRAKYGFDADTCSILTSIDEQSPDIAMGVDRDGAGDQGMMFGFACDETPTLMPMPIYYAHKLAQRLTLARKNNILSFLRPDGKTQVTVEYEDDKPKRIDTIVISSQHSSQVSQDAIKDGIIENVIKPVIPAELMDKNTKILINPTGQFIIGGPQADSGLTGRKIIVDTYGGYACHGGGAFSGKDPSKVDRSAAYMARYIAKNIVAAGLAKKCEVQLSYAIGIADPVSVLVDTKKTGVINDDIISEAVKKVFPLTPAGIISCLDLRKPIYAALSSYGHMGREDLKVRWEDTDKTESLKKALNIK